MTQEKLIENLRKMHSSSKYYIKQWGLHFNSIEEIEKMINICKEDKHYNIPTDEAEMLLKQLKEVK